MPLAQGLGETLHLVPKSIAPLGMWGSRELQSRPESLSLPEVEGYALKTTGFEQEC